MAQYIDKDKIVSEIKKLIRQNELYLSENASDLIRFQKTSAYSVLNNVLHFLDTLEVKEVDLDEDFLKDYNQAIEDVCEYLKNNIDESLVIYNKHTWCKRDEFINKLKKTMKE